MRAESSQVLSLAISSSPRQCTVIALIITKFVRGAGEAEISTSAQEGI